MTLACIRLTIKSHRERNLTVSSESNEWSSNFQGFYLIMPFTCEATSIFSKFSGTSQKSKSPCSQVWEKSTNDQFRHIVSTLSFPGLEIRLCCTGNETAEEINCGNNGSINKSTPPNSQPPKTSGKECC